MPTIAQTAKTTKISLVPLLPLKAQIVNLVPHSICGNGQMLVALFQRFRGGQTFAKDRRVLKRIRWSTDQRVQPSKEEYVFVVAVWGCKGGAVSEEKP